MREQGVEGKEEALREGGATGFCFYGNRTALSLSLSLSRWKTLPIHPPGSHAFLRSSS